MTLKSDTLTYVSLDELLANSDVISLHCPLFDSTKGIVSKNNIAKMKDGVIIINTSRGPLIVEEDLAEALNSGKVYAAALDVVSTEPLKLIIHYLLPRIALSRLILPGRLKNPGQD
jgi:glycerate dehydrogenase